MLLLSLSRVWTLTRKLEVARSRGRGVPLDKAPVDPFVAGLKFRETSVQGGQWLEQPDAG